MTAEIWTLTGPARYDAYLALMEPTSWDPDAWDEVVAHLDDPDHHNRSLAAQWLCNLASQDASGRIETDLDALMAVTRDPRFVTARHALQSLWKIGLGGAGQRRLILERIDGRFRESAGEKNGTLIRSDLVESLRRLFDATADPDVEATARALVECEPDPKYQRKLRKLLEVGRRG
ncbi:hypothetical protein [Cryptosporangium phraense]|uniref:HEAT repeat domain-containing protein n=1 Tax=Cryptosporangium phraense TaxID=2593070 RepID=A0A545AXK7_9ACTN|nr:hypothetical protein [Cryptosporangium phraense]TQS46069.1 hypothetical protein FL583_06175 [Cryptosporangium phraense]